MRTGVGAIEVTTRMFLIKGFGFRGRVAFMLRRLREWSDTHAATVVVGKFNLPRGADAGASIAP